MALCTQACYAGMEKRDAAAARGSMAVAMREETAQGTVLQRNAARVGGVMLQFARTAAAVLRLRLAQVTQRTATRCVRGTHADIINSHYIDILFSFITDTLSPLPGSFSFRFFAHHYFRFY